MFTTPWTRATGAGLLAAGFCLVVLISTGLGGCAHVSSPPGGPPDTIPPILIAVVPDSYSVVPGFEDELRFEFDEAISEQGIQSSVILYPFEVRPKVKKGKRELKVKPREGWVEDRIYHVQVQPVVQDLFRNSIKEPIDYVFSTGMPMTENRVQGVVFDRITERPLPRSRVDMVLLPDTLRYGGSADTAGAFDLTALPPGEFLAIGYEDLNNNQRADDFDRADTLRVNVSPEDRLDLEFQVFRHDTLGPQLTLVEAADSNVVMLEFDGYLDPQVGLRTADVEVFALADSTPVTVDSVMHDWQFVAWRDSVEAALREAALDSLRALEAEADTLALEAPPPAPEPEAEAEMLEQEAPEAEEPAALPERRIYIITTARIPAGTHVVRVRNLTNLSGLVGGGESEFEPAPPPEEEPEPPPERSPG